MKTIRFTIDAIGRIPDDNADGLTMLEYADLVAQGIDPQPDAIYIPIRGEYTIPPTEYADLAHRRDANPYIRDNDRWLASAWVMQAWGIDNLQIEHMTVTPID